MAIFKATLIAQLSKASDEKHINAELSLRQAYCKLALQCCLQFTLFANNLHF